jgi:hypothetical protein
MNGAGTGGVLQEKNTPDNGSIRLIKTGKEKTEEMCLLQSVNRIAWYDRKIVSKNVHSQCVVNRGFLLMLNVRSFIFRNRQKKRRQWNKSN